MDFEGQGLWSNAGSFTLLSNSMHLMSCEVNLRSDKISSGLLERLALLHFAFLFYESRLCNINLESRHNFHAESLRVRQIILGIGG